MITVATSPFSLVSLAAISLVTIVCHPITVVTAAQQIFLPAPPISSLPPASQRGVGHFSEWSSAVKTRFLNDVRAGLAGNWTVVLGNEAGDLDSLASAFSLAYHLGHVDPSRPAIGLLQTPFDALDLRPENKLALDNVKMTAGHQDLLTIDELPIPPKHLASQLRGIVLVDHPTPLPDWANAKVQGIIDHHLDRGHHRKVHPRIFEPVASCSSLVGRLMLDELEELPDGGYHMPHELLELLLSAIAIDSDGLKSKITTPTDHFIASRLFGRSNWRHESMYDKIMDVSQMLKKARKDLDHLNVRDLLRRDWKGGIVRTGKKLPDVHLGFASIPYSLSRQISITPNKSLSDWFAIERNWTSEIRADITVALLSYKISLDAQIKSSPKLIETSGDYELDVEETLQEFDTDQEADTYPSVGKLQSVKRKGKVKERQIVLVVRADHRISETQADSLFHHIVNTIDSSKVLLANRWKGSGDLGRRQMVWTHRVATGGRKLVRPIVEDAVKSWK